MEPVCEEYKGETWHRNNGKWFIWRQSGKLTQYLNHDGVWKATAEYWETKEEAEKALQGAK